MYKVLIVEDEPPIRRMIKKLVEHHQEFCVTHMASNGEEALNIINEGIQFDLIMTDIRMPIMDGLAFLEQLNRLGYDCLKLILTGYEDFNYAKKALKLDVYDYLLKPISLEHINGQLAKLAEILASGKTQKEDQYMDALVMDLPLTDFTASPLKKYQQFGILYACAGSFPYYYMDCLIPGKQYWQHHYETLNVLLQGHHPASNFWLFHGKSSAEIFIIFGFEVPISNDTFSKFCTEIHESLPKTLPLTTLFSKTFSSEKDLNINIQWCRNLLYKNILFGKSHIIDAQNAFNEQSYNKLPDGTYSEILESALVNSNYETFCLELKKILSTYEDSTIPQYILHKHLRYFSLNLSKVCEKTSDISLDLLDLEINEAISNATCFNSLHADICSIFSQFFSENTNHDETFVLMHKIQSYLDHTFREPLTNQDLSEKFGFVPSYLSRLFKAYCGFSPQEYILHKRIEHAKVLLKTNQDMLLKEISMDVGYQDPFYFSKCFKKVVGVSPQQYKKM